MHHSSQNWDTPFVCSSYSSLFSLWTSIPLYLFPVPHRKSQSVSLGLIRIYTLVVHLCFSRYVGPSLKRRASPHIKRSPSQPSSPNTHIELQKLSQDFWPRTHATSSLHSGTQWHPPPTHLLVSNLGLWSALYPLCHGSKQTCRSCLPTANLSLGYSGVPGAMGCSEVCILCYHEANLFSWLCTVFLHLCDSWCPLLFWLGFSVCHLA